MAHNHSHDHASGHAHAPADFGRAFAIGVTLNLGFVVAEAVFGVLSNSLALLADAGHNLSDVLGLLLAWGASILAKRIPSQRFTYGLRSSTILAALFNAILLLIAIGAIAWEAIQRFGHPEPVNGITVIAVAALGVVINTVTALLFMAGRKHDVNIRGAFLHMAADAGVSLGVVLAGIGILATGWLWLDPAISLTIVVVILAGTWGLLRESLGLALQAVPKGVDPGAVKAFLAGLPGVAEVHDLHIWAMSTTEWTLTAHLVCPAGHPGDAFLSDAAEKMQRRFKIQHLTLQIEVGDSQQSCQQAPEHCV